MSQTNSQPALPSLARASWLVQPETQAVLAAVRRTGHPARIVGGAVRNALLGLAVTDIDIATPALPEAVMKACEAAGLQCIPTGLKHGTVTVMAGHISHEVTTLRRDIDTDGRHATVAFTDDWSADAARRDFTVNALSCDEAGRVFDSVDGYADILARRIRFIGNADTRISEDYLRILRFFRFHATYGRDALDAEGLAACIRGRDGLGRLSAERVRAEMLKLLVAPGAVAAIGAMMDCGLLPLVLGAAPRPGALQRIVAAEIRAGTKPDPMLRVSALAVAVAEDVDRLAVRLRLSNAERAQLLVIDGPSMDRLASLDDRAARKLIYEQRPVRARQIALVMIAAGGDHELRGESLLRHCEAWPIPVLPVRGADVLALGVAPGPEVGAVLEEIERWWVAADFPAAATVRVHLKVLVDQRHLRP